VRPQAGAWRQLWAVARWEWRRQLRGMRLAFLLVLALLPVALAAAMAALPVHLEWRDSVNGVREVYANFYHLLVVRVVLFFGCLAGFLGLIRGEVETRTLHYFFLAPVRRPLVVLGKYLAAVTVAWALFVPATALSLAAVYRPAAAGGLLPAAAWGDLPAYLAMTLLGCLGYGALFVALGALLRGPGLVVALFFAWEWFEFLLPPVLKQLSVVHYLKALTPFPIADGPFALLAEPTAPWLAALQLLLYIAVAVGVAVLAVRRMEVSYGAG
jgi:ABC-type transport system involved in multi-copper enzyme maturation permease subunit